MREIIAYLCANMNYSVNWRKYLVYELAEVLGWDLDTSDSLDFTKNFLSKGVSAIIIGK